MSDRAVGLALACALAFAAPAALACIWDRDTLAQERARFPTALELLTGKFIRHPPEFCAWRLRDHQARLAAAPDDLALVDDLAVAHDKLSQHADAIAAMQAILPRDRRARGSRWSGAGPPRRAPAAGPVGPPGRR